MIVWYRLFMKNCISKSPSITFPPTLRSWDHRRSDPQHTAHTHDDWGLTNVCLLSMTCTRLFSPLLLLPQPFVEAVYSSEIALRSAAGKTASPDQETGGGGSDWFSCWMCCSSLWQPKSPYWALSVLIGALAFEMCAVIRPREPTA